MLLQPELGPKSGKSVRITVERIAIEKVTVDMSEKGCLLHAKTPLSILTKNSILFSVLSVSSL